MGAADAAGDAAAGDELLDAVAAGDANDVADLDAGDIDDLDLAGDVTGLDAVVRAGELCALANVNGANTSTAMAIYETVNFMTTLSLFRLRRGSSGTVWTAPSKSVRLDPRVIWRGYWASAPGVNTYSTAKFEIDRRTAARPFIWLVPRYESD
jgi:hypothetical protein